MVVSNRIPFTGFRSVLYRSGYVYNFVNQRAFEFKKKFMTLAKFSTSKGCKKVLDLPCGTGYLTRYLPRSVTYEGWDLNHRFLKKIRKDWDKGRIKPNKLVLKQKNIFNYEEYPDDVDSIVFCDILHHVTPRHIELVENAKKRVDRIIICEPLYSNPKNFKGQDWISKMTLFAARILPDKLYQYVDFLLADNDGINKFDDRSQWEYDRKGLMKLYNDLGIKDEKIYHLDEELIGIWEA